MQKVGVLLVNLGTPDAPTYGAVYRYLKEFLLDKRVIDIPAIPRNLLVRGIIAPFRSKSSAALYKKLWTEEGSPLKVYGFALRDALARDLGDGFCVELAMRYQNPSIAESLKKLMQVKISKLIVLPLFPQYASATTGSVHEEVMRVLSGFQVIPELKFINSYPTHSGMIDAFVEQAKSYNLGDFDHVLFSFHGLPERQIRKADSSNHCLRPNCCSSVKAENQFCYCAQCNATARAIAEALELKPEHYTICYQSRLGRDPWIKPYTSDVLKEMAQKSYKKLLVFCPAFVSDCLETTIEIGEEYQEEFEHLGGELVQLVPGLNDSPKWIKAAAQIVKENV